MLECKTESAAETQHLGERIGKLLRSGDTLLLSGELGAGKTTFVKGIAHGMGIRDAVTSPTFTLIQEYGTAGCKLIHVDPYRLDSDEDLVGIGIDEYLDSGNVLAVEWGERLGTLSPSNRLDVRIETLAEDRRRIYFTPHGERYRDLLEKITSC